MQIIVCMPFGSGVTAVHEVPKLIVYMIDDVIVFFYRKGFILYTVHLETTDGLDFKIPNERYIV